MKLLFILFLLPILSYGQITVTPVVLTNGDTIYKTVSKTSITVTEGEGHIVLNKKAIEQKIKDLNFEMSNQEEEIEMMKIRLEDIKKEKAKYEEMLKLIK